MSEVLDSLHPTLRELPGKTIVGRYRVDEALGVGGMGAVFRGRHLGLKRDVAIKVLHPDLTRDPEISKRFDREAHSASRLDHPNCLRVTDVGSTEDGVKFMVMDLLSGTELADRLGEPMAPDRAVLMVLQILRGLEHAHDNGVIHRDVKPENIFITRDHENREVLKLVDFGIAKLAGGGGGNDTRMTKAGLIFGTPAYMSPEQAMGVEADARADLYSVGVILYEMLSGSPPFESDDPVKLVRMQVSRDPPPLPDSVPPMLAAVVMKLLAKDRDDRFQTATEAREVLELILPSFYTGDVVTGATPHGARTSGPVMMMMSAGGSGAIQMIGGQPATGPIPMIMGQPATGPIPMIMLHPSTGPFPLFPASQSSVSQPIVVASVSNPSSVSMPMPSEQGSGMFSPAALPTLPPGSTVLQPRAPNRRLVYGGVAAVVLVLGIWAVAGGDDDVREGSGSGGAAVVAGHDDEEEEAGAEAPAEGADDGGNELLMEDGPDEARLAEIDRMIFADKLGEAQQLLQPLLDEYPANSMLAWRQGRIFAKSKKPGAKTKALAAYRDAVDTDPLLLDDHDFYAELHALLVNPKLRTEALNFALRKMGHNGHKFLLELVNDERNPLSYNDRRRALQELATIEENAPLINLQLHRALDLLQATQAMTPCTAYRDALDSIMASPDWWYHQRVERAPMPVPKTGKNLSAEDKADAAQCEGIDVRRAEVLAELAKLAPVEDTTGGDEEIVLDDDSAEGAAADGAPADGASQAPAKKSSGSKSSGGNTTVWCKMGFKKQCR
jgi:serine/threonine protein kinase